MNTSNIDNTITLHIYNDMVEANFAMSQLLENGIEAFLEDENVLGLNPMGGVQLKIFEKDLTTAQEILSSSL